MFVAADFWWIVGRIGNLSTDFRHTSIILELFIILPAILSLERPDGAIDALQLNNTGGIELGVFLALGTGIKLHKRINTSEFLGQFST